MLKRFINSRRGTEDKRIKLRIRKSTNYVSIQPSDNKNIDPNYIIRELSTLENTKHLQYNCNINKELSKLTHNPDPRFRRVAKEVQTTMMDIKNNIVRTEKIAKDLLENQDFLYCLRNIVDAYSKLRQNSEKNYAAMDTNIFEFKQTNITNNDEQPEVENINYDKHTSPNPNYKNRSLQKDIENKQNTDEPVQNSIDCTLQANDNILCNKSNEVNAEEVHTISSFNQTDIDNFRVIPLTSSKYVNIEVSIDEQSKETNDYMKEITTNDESNLLNNENEESSSNITISPIIQGLNIDMYDYDL